jgi:hypothetical protein
VRRLFPLILLGAVAVGAYILVASLARTHSPQAPRTAEAPVIGTPADRALEAVSGSAALTPTVDPLPPVDGQPFELALIEPAATSYGAGEWEESDRVYAAALDRLGLDDVDYDPALGRAARELAVFYSFHQQPAPTEALQFVLNSAGATEWGVLQSYLTTTKLEDAMVAERVKALRAKLDDLGEGVRVGVGESYTVGANPVRSVCVLVSRGGFYLERFQRATKPGATVRLAGVLPRGASQASVVGFGPTREFLSWTVLEAAKDGTKGAADGRFTVDLEIPSKPGRVLVEINAVLPSGPMPLAQLELYAGTRIPERFDGHWPPAETDIQTDLDAEAQASLLLDIDRTRNGLAPLIDDPKLVAIARAHSRDMRDKGFVGHVSPTTGSVGDRLRAAGYRAAHWGENIAGNNNLWDAEAGLYYSLGHRKNLLSKNATHVGIGVAATRKHGRRYWLVTQVFAAPIAKLDVAKETARLYKAAQAMGASDGRVYTIDRGLERAARLEAKRDEPTPSGALERATINGALKIGGFAWTSRRFNPKDFVLPEALLRPGLSRIGIGVYQEQSGSRPITSVVVIGGGG